MPQIEGNLTGNIKILLVVPFLIILLVEQNAPKQFNIFTKTGICKNKDKGVYQLSNSHHHE